MTDWRLLIYSHFKIVWKEKRYEVGGRAIDDRLRAFAAISDLYKIDEIYVYRGLNASISAAAWPCYFLDRTGEKISQSYVFLGAADYIDIICRLS